MISVLSNVMPAAVHDMVTKYLNGNIKSALDIQLKYLDLIEALFCEVNPIPVKAAMKLLGYDVGGLRLPLTELEDANRARLKESMENLRKISGYKRILKKIKDKLTYGKTKLEAGAIC